jgi:hypothetical protein
MSFCFLWKFSNFVREPSILMCFIWNFERVFLWLCIEHLDGDDWNKIKSSKTKLSNLDSYIKVFNVRRVRTINKIILRIKLVIGSMVKLINPFVSQCGQYRNYNLKSYQHNILVSTLKRRRFLHLGELINLHVLAFQPYSGFFYFDFHSFHLENGLEIS